jgi:hypothetical protein
MVEAITCNCTILDFKYIWCLSCIFSLTACEAILLAIS